MQFNNHTSHRSPGLGTSVQRCRGGRTSACIITMIVIIISNHTPRIFIITSCVTLCLRFQVRGTQFTLLPPMITKSQTVVSLFELPLPQGDAMLVAQHNQLRFAQLRHPHQRACWMCLLTNHQGIHMLEFRDRVSVNLVYWHYFIDGIYQCVLCLRDSQLWVM